MNYLDKMMKMPLDAALHLMPRAPYATAPIIKEKMHEMLLTCLSGGMSYADAKEACALEFGEKLKKADLSDKEEWKDYEGRLMEFDAAYNARALWEENNSKSEPKLKATFFGWPIAMP